MSGGAPQAAFGFLDLPMPHRLRFFHLGGSITLPTVSKVLKTLREELIIERKDGTSDIAADGRRGSTPCRIPDTARLPRG